MNSNKDYIINLRVSRATYKKIKERAKENGETMSNLVRKAISDGMEIISDISKDVFPRGEGVSDVVAHHSAKAAKDTECDKCSSKIRSGDAVTIGETKSGKGYFFCSKCRD